MLQKEIELPSFTRGFHLITDIIISAIPKDFSDGVLHVFCKHTSAGLTLNENYDPDVRADFVTIMNKLVPESPYYKHSSEGDDDMPAHFKSSLIGTSLLIPITNGKLNLGIWQGIYFCEFRNNASRRKLVLTFLP